MLKSIKGIKTKLLIAIITLLIIGVGFAAAYFQAQVGSGANVSVSATTKTTDLLTFSKGNDISITANQSNFYSGAGNRTGITTASATLLANNDTNSATQTYNVYLYIQSNNFEYTTSPTNTPELMLTITNPNNQAVTSLTELTYTTSGGVSGFDITTKKGLIQIASNYSITSTGTKTDTWNITVTLINLNTDQQINTEKTFTGQIIIQKGIFEEPAYYWNDGFSDLYYDVFEMPQTIYSSFSQLSSFPGFNNNPFYIKAQPLYGKYYYYVTSDDYDVSYIDLFEIADTYNFLTFSYEEDITKNDGSANLFFSIIGGQTYTIYYDGTIDDFSNDYDEFEKTVKNALVNEGFLYTMPAGENSKVCLYYNNHELCLAQDYWVSGDYTGELTAEKLQTDMESTLDVSSVTCDYNGRVGSAWCTLDDYKCNLAPTNGYLRVSCGSSTHWCVYDGVYYCYTNNMNND